MNYHAVAARRSIARISVVVFALCVISSIAYAETKSPAAPINLNTATWEELQLVPGIVEMRIARDAAGS
jgi:DNA uptake protein ComE-like DNA-binding protein